MKKALFFLIIMGCAALASAQESAIGVTYQNGVYNNGDTINVYIGAEDHNCTAIGFKNQGNSYLEGLIISLEELTHGCAEIYGLCLGDNCLARLTSDPYTIDIPIHGTYDRLVLDFTNNYAEEAIATPSSYTLTIGNADIATTVVLVFRISGVGIEEVNNMESSISIYPNPAASVVNVTLDGNDQPSTVSIWNMAGQQVAETAVAAGTTNFSLNVADLPKGVYNVILNNNGRSTTKKLVIR